MTRERAKELAPIIQAYGEGKTIQFRCGDSDTWEDLEQGRNASFRYDLDYRNKPVPSTRPMTRGEVLYMVTTTPAMVVRGQGGIYECPAAASDYTDDISEMKYAIIDKQGNPIDGWHKFEIEE